MSNKLFFFNTLLTAVLISIMILWTTSMALPKDKLDPTASNTTAQDELKPKWQLILDYYNEQHGTAVSLYGN